MEQSRDLTQLFDACAQGKVDVVGSLLDSGFDVNATDEDDVTALQLAAANGQEQVVRLLLLRGAAVDQANLTGWTPLLHAARNGHSAVAALLIQNHANISAQTCYGASVACLAARSGSLATCRLLEGAGVSFAAASGHVSKVGSTLEIVPLVVAAHRGHDSLVKHLLSSADVNYPVKPTEVTALMGAVVGGHVSTARLVVERGKADVNAVDINDKSALDYSIALSKQQVKEYLQTKTTRCQYPALKQSMPSIIEAVKQGNIEKVRDILDGDISQRDACMPHDGATPLMFSAMLGHVAIVQLLVEKGSNINAQDVVNGWTALMQAIFHGQKEVAVFLLQAGADVTVPAKSGCNAFDMASIIADVDAELYRLIAARVMPVVVPQQMAVSSQSRASSTDTVNQRTGIKAWWTRISNRFHNLKQTESISSNTHELPEVANDATLKDSTMITQPSNDAFVKSLSSNQVTAVIGPGNYFSTDRMVKNDTTFSFDMSGIMMPGSGVSTLKSTAPPIFPLPSFHNDRTSKIPPAGLRKPLTNQSRSQTLSLTRTISSGAKPSPTQHSMLNLVNRIASPPPRVQFAKRPAVKMQVAHVSPSASCDATTLGGSGSGDAIHLPRTSKCVLSSASSSTLTAGSDNNANKTSPSVELLRSKRNKLDSNIDSKSIVSRLDQRSCHNVQYKNFAAADHAATPNLSSLGKDSGISTGVVLSCKVTADHRYHDISGSELTDLGGILQKLSLECYRPVFEEQEVDMEAFLTLNDCDLRELGIQSSESRRQILATISELNVSKDRQQQLRGQQPAFDTAQHRISNSKAFEIDSLP